MDGKGQGEEVGEEKGKREKETKTIMERKERGTGREQNGIRKWKGKNKTRKGKGRGRAKRK